MGLPVRLVTFMGTHLSTRSGVMTRPTLMLWGKNLEEVGWTITVLPGDMGTFFGSLPQTRCSCFASKVTDGRSLTVLITSGSLSPLNRDEFAKGLTNCCHSGRRSLWERRCQQSSVTFSWCMRNLMTFVPMIRSSCWPGTMRTGTALSAQYHFRLIHVVWFAQCPYATYQHSVRGMGPESIFSLPIFSSACLLSVHSPLNQNQASPAPGMCCFCLQRYKTVCRRDPVRPITPWRPEALSRLTVGNLGSWGLDYIWRAAWSHFLTREISTLKCWKKDWTLVVHRVDLWSIQVKSVIKLTVTEHFSFNRSSNFLTRVRECRREVSSTAKHNVKHFFPSNVDRFSSAMVVIPQQKQGCSWSWAT